MTLPTNFLKSTLLIAVGAFIVTLLICSFALFFLILPSLGAKDTLDKENLSTQGNINNINSSVTRLLALDKTELDTYSTMLGIFYPEEGDHFHFATLNEQLASSLGVKITAVGIVTKAPVKTPAPAVGPAAGSTSAAASAPSTTPAATGGGDIYFQVTYIGEFTAIETLLERLDNLDRVVGVSRVSISPIEGSTNVSANVSFDLPLAAKSTPTTQPSNVPSLSAEDKKLLAQIKDRIEFSALPAETPIGKENPFH